MGYTLHFSVVWENFGQLLNGLGLGLLLAIVAVGIGAAIGLMAAFASIGGSLPARLIVRLYVSVLRNLPILVIVLVAYFGLPQIGIRLNKYESFAGSLALYSGAYLAEVFRGGLMGIPPGVVEAARAIGLTRLQINTSVVAPIMLRNVLPALGSTFIGLFKDTSMAAAIAVPELTFQARRINVESFRVVETWSVTSFLYIATCVLIAATLRRVERRFPKF
jgi:His/Glu/Gln/Arg/opine family amino acid ABC transporter permease subunit